MTKWEHGDTTRLLILAVLGWIFGVVGGATGCILLAFNGHQPLAVGLLIGAWVVLVWAFGALVRTMTAVLRDLNES